MLNDDPGIQQSFQAADVVGMGMGQDHAGQPGDTFIPEYADQRIRALFASSIDQVGAIPASQQQRVCLADVDCQQGELRFTVCFSTGS